MSTFGASLRRTSLPQSSPSHSINRAIRSDSNGGHASIPVPTKTITKQKSSYTKNNNNRKNKQLRYGRRYWDYVENHRNFFNNAASKLTVEQYNDWYNFAPDDLNNNKNGSNTTITTEEINATSTPTPATPTSSSNWLQFYGGSLVLALETVYPEYEWQPWKFSKVSRSFWEDLSNQRRYLDQVAQELNISTVQDWYRVRMVDILSQHGHGLMNYYQRSLIHALETVYPDYPWQVWQFQHVPRRYWHAESNTRDYLHWVSNDLQLSSMDDWNKVSITHQIKASPLQRNGGLANLLVKHYPGHSWEISPSSYPSNSKFQRLLYRAIQV